MCLLRVFYFLTLVVASSTAFSASKTGYLPSTQPSTKLKSQQGEDVLANRSPRVSGRYTWSFDAGLTNGFFYDKENQKSVFYFGVSKEFEQPADTWVLAAQLGSAGHAFFKVGQQWDWGDNDGADLIKPRLFIVNNLEVSQYFASLVNYNHYKIEANLLIKNLFEVGSPLQCEIAVGYGLNGFNYSYGLGYGF